jgi:putative peptidoglycan lipid II flippase
MIRRPSILRAAGLVSLATMMSRVLGLAREITIAYLFGGEARTDAFFAAFRIPNLLRDLFAEGALSAAFVPTFTACYRRRGPEAAWRLANTVINVLLVILGAFALLLVLAARPFVYLVASGFDEGKAELAAQMVRIMSPFLAAVALAAVLMGILNALGRFFVPALAPAMFNVGVIGCAWLLGGPLEERGIDPVVSLAVGALVGGAGQFLLQIPAVRRAGLRWRPRIDWRDPALRRVLTLMGPAAFGLAATFVNVVVDTQMASYFGDGPISYLQYAFRIWMLPVGVFAVALATANLARVSHEAAEGDRQGLARSVSKSMRLSLALTLPATAAFLTLGEPIVRLLYEHRNGRFGPEDTRQVALALAAYAVGLAGYALVKLLVPTFYAIGETWYPVRVAAFAVGTKIVLNFLLAYGLPFLGLPGLGFQGLALATGLAAWVNALLLLRALRGRLVSGVGEGLGRTATGVALVAAVMGVVVKLAHDALSGLLPAGNPWAEGLTLGLVIILGLVVTFAGLLATGVREARELLERFGRRRS